MNEKQEFKRRVIVSRMTRSRFIHVEDALDIGKLRFFVGEYVAKGGMKRNAYHFMDVDDARVVFGDIADGRPVKYQEYKGSSGVSRMLEINEKDGSYWFVLRFGPGITTATGAVLPDKNRREQFVDVLMGLDRHQARALAHAVMAYVRVWESRVWGEA